MFEHLLDDLSADFPVLYFGLEGLYFGEEALLLPFGDIVLGVGGDGGVD